MVTARQNGEQQFLDMLYRIEGMRRDIQIVHLKLSALSATDRQDERQNHVMTSLLDAFLSRSKARLFSMSDGDFFIVVHSLSRPLLQNLTDALRRLYRSDPLTKAPPIRFCEVIELEYEYDAVLKLARQKADNAGKATLKKEQPRDLVPLAPEHLDAILRNIRGFNILKVIRRQEAIRISRNGKYTSLFKEYFTSMADLKAAIAPDVDVLSNRWLFQHLSETLDERMLSVHDSLFARTPGNISLNLNISTIFTNAFEHFLEQMPESKFIVVEVQLMDIIQNTKNFITAKELLREAGHKILIDGLHPISLQFLDLNLLDPDLIKLNWSAAILENAETSGLKDALKEIDPEKIVLMRCEDENAVKWGLTNGITRFQGYFIDALSGAGVKRKCQNGDGCSLQQCIARKSCIAGSVRSQCLNQDALDSLIEENL